MNWKPQTEEELAKEELCAEGLQPFTVMQAAVQQSKSGKDMIKLKLNVHGDDGFDYHIYDYISPEFLAYKFRHFFFSVGRGADYEAGTVDVDGLVGLTGWADIKVQAAKDGYDPKNVIKDYSVQKNSKKDAANPTPKPTSKPAVKPGEDDVPF